LNHWGSVVRCGFMGFLLSPLPPGEGGAQRRVRVRTRAWFRVHAYPEPSPPPLSRRERGQKSAQPDGETMCCSSLPSGIAFVLMSSLVFGKVTAEARMVMPPRRRCARCVKEPGL